jgi:hypothetical protein
VRGLDIRLVFASFCRPLWRLVLVKILVNFIPQVAANGVVCWVVTECVLTHGAASWFELFDLSSVFQA